MKFSVPGGACSLVELIHFVRIYEENLRHFTALFTLRKSFSWSQIRLFVASLLQGQKDRIKILRRNSFFFLFPSKERALVY